jgi:lipopolysaccharide/colanic/teichoic acid biosynthesis glycosyltransferase
MTSDNTVSYELGERSQSHRSDSRLRRESGSQKLPSHHESKLWVDRLVAGVLLIPLAPLIALLVVLVKSTSRGPGIYAQRRLGKGQQPYVMYKLRSMRNDAEQGTGAAWCQHGDPRITRLGRILRKLHLDELPQLWNVLRGDMALVGPRPERPEFVEVLRKAVEGYDRRMDVLPGITGLAQINLPADSNVESVRRKLVLDCDYINEASWSLDLRILACTALRVVGISGERAMRMTGCYRTVDLPVGSAEALSGSVSVSELIERSRQGTGESRAGESRAGDDAVSISADETLVERSGMVSEGEQVHGERVQAVNRERDMNRAGGELHAEGGRVLAGTVGLSGLGIGGSNRNLGEQIS